jgi:short-subunit dehydrogenase
MVERGRGAVLNLSSIVAYAPQPLNATYGATKAFVTSLTEALHTELAGTGVSCTSVSPGPTRTAIWERSGAEGAPDTGPDLLWSDPEEVARAAVDAMVAGRRSVIPGATNRLAVLGYHLTPRTALLPLTRLAQRALLRRVRTGDR